MPRLTQVPQLPRDEIEDLVLGCAQPAGEQGYNLGRVVALLTGLRDLPGTTVNRYCASSLMAVRIAAHAIRAGEGQAFVAAGVETVSRFTKGKSDGLPDTHNPAFSPAEARTAERALVARPPGRRSMNYPTSISGWATRPRTWRRSRVSPGRRWTHSPPQSQQRAVAAQENGFFDREITPVTLPDGRVVSRDDGPRPGTTAESLAELKPVFRPDGRVTAGNACPLNDGAAAVVVMSGERARELGIRPLARIVSTAVSRWTLRSWG